MKFDLCSPSDIEFVSQPGFYLAKIVNVIKEKRKKDEYNITVVWQVVDSGEEKGRYMCKNFRVYLGQDENFKIIGYELSTMLKEFNVPETNFELLINKYMFVKVDRGINLCDLSYPPHVDNLYKIPDAVYLGLKNRSDDDIEIDLSNKRLTVSTQGIYLAKIVRISFEKDIAKDCDTMNVIFKIVDFSSQRWKILEDPFPYRIGNHFYDEKFFRAELKKFFLMFDIPDFDADKLLNRLAIIKVASAPRIWKNKLKKYLIHSYHPMTQELIDDLLAGCNV